MSQIKAFIKKVEDDAKLREKFDTIFKMHEKTRDKDALGQSLIEFAKRVGFEITADELRILLTPKQEMKEEELEDVTGGGWSILWCRYESAFECGEKIIINPKYYGDQGTGRYNGKCPGSGRIFCTWAGCRCHGLDVCKDGWHECGQNGVPLCG